MSAFAFGPALATDRGPVPVRAELPAPRHTFAERARPTPRRVDERVHAALDVPRLTVTRMADVLGVPRATLEAYRLGTRRMPAPVRARLAEFLARHAELVRQIAEALRAEDRVEEPTPEPAAAAPEAAAEAAPEPGTNPDA